MRKAPELPTYSDYLSILIGSTVMAITEEEYSVCLHMGSGHTMEISGIATGGFSISVLLPKERH